MDKSTHQMRLVHWKSVVEQCSSRPAGQSARSWLQENNISAKQYYYWQRIIRREAYEQMTKEGSSQHNEITFAEFRIPDSSDSSPHNGHDGYSSSTSPIHADAVINTINGTVVFTNTTSPDLIRSVMEVMLHA